MEKIRIAGVPPWISFGVCWWCGREIVNKVMVKANGQIECDDHWENTIEMEPVASREATYEMSNLRQ